MAPPRNEEEKESRGAARHSQARAKRERAWLFIASVSLAAAMSPISSYRGGGERGRGREYPWREKSLRARARACESRRREDDERTRTPRKGTYDRSPY